MAVQKNHKKLPTPALKRVPVDSSPIEIWVTAGGTRIPIAELTDDHLKNILTHLRSRYSSLRDEATRRGIINRDLFEDSFMTPGEIALMIETYFEEYQWK